MESTTQDFETVARRRLGMPSDEFRFCIWEYDRKWKLMRLYGAIPLPELDGARIEKGSPLRWPKRKGDLLCAAVTADEAAVEFQKYESSTKKCGECRGTGEVWAGWSKTEGCKSKPCPRCEGTKAARACSVARPA